MQDSSEERFERIESAVAHLQHDIESLNTSLLRQSARMQEIEQRFIRIEHELETFTSLPEKRDPAAERPPHY